MQIIVVILVVYGYAHLQYLGLVLLQVRLHVDAIVTRRAGRNHVRTLHLLLEGLIPGIIAWIMPYSVAATNYPTYLDQDMQM